MKKQKELNADFIDTIKDIKTAKQKQEVEEILGKYYGDTLVHDYLRMIVEINEVVYKDFKNYLNE